MTTAQRTVLVLFAVIAALAWWWQGWNLADEYITGAYIAKVDELCSTLTLNPDHSFDQQVWRGDRSSTPAIGSWHRIGEGGLAMSGTFIGVTAQDKSKDLAYGVIDSTFGFHTIWLYSIPYRKNVLHLRTCP